MSEFKKIKGLGPKSVEKLNQAGINTVKDLAKASVGDVIRTGFTEKKANLIIKDATDIVNGVTPAERLKKGAKKEKVKKAPKKKKRGKIPTCKKPKGCGFSFEINSKDDLDNRNKSWSMVAPMPDKDGNVTISQLATWKCPRCGRTIRGTVGKTKGEFSGKSRKDQIIEMLGQNITFNIDEFATAVKGTRENLEKAIKFMVKKGIADGKIVGDEYIPN